MNNSQFDEKANAVHGFPVSRRSSRRVTVTSFAETISFVEGLLISRPEFGLRLVLAEPIEAGTLIAVEWDDSLILGEIIYCIRNCSGYHTAIKTDENFVRLQIHTEGLEADSILN